MANDDHIAHLKKRVTAWQAWRWKNSLLKQHKRQGICKLPPDAIVKARDDTAAQVNRIILTFVGAVIFCVLSLLTPDSALLVGGEKLSVPLAGPVSFFGFILLAPAVLIILRIYLQIYVEHQRRLDRVAQWIPAARAPMLTPDKNPLLRGFRGLAFYLLLPLAIFAFWWKAAVFPEWGQAFAIVAAAVIAMHLTLPFRTLSWGLRTIIILGVAILALAATVGFNVSMRRPFNLFRANLSDQWLVSADLKGGVLRFANLAHASLARADLTAANLTGANLTGADLNGTNLTSAELFFANLTGAELGRANFSGANLNGANLTGAHLEFAKLAGAKIGGANLTGANFSGANLTGANLGVNLAGINLQSNLNAADLTGALGLSQQQLDRACGDAKTRLPPGLSVKLCDQH